MISASVDLTGYVFCFKKKDSIKDKSDNSTVCFSALKIRNSVMKSLDVCSMNEITFASLFSTSHFTVSGIHFSNEKIF